MTRRRCLSIFSGGGGMDLGFEQAGWHVVGATDNERDCQQTFLNNRPSIPFKLGDASEYSHKFFDSFVRKDDLENVDCLIGGPPCPAFSKSRFYRKDKPRGINDPSADTTLRGYLQVLKELRPPRFVLENVKGLIYKSHKEALDFIVSNLVDLGYRYDIWVLNAADYGVPQIRERAFIVGSLDALPARPVPTHSKFVDASRSDLKQWVPVKEAIGNLSSVEIEDIPGHFAGGKHHDLLRSVPPGDNYLCFTEKRGHPNPQFKWRSRYWSFLLKLSPDMPSWTIQARRSNNMGPFHWMNRILTIDEVKRIQTFPDDWELAGTIESQWRQVGNAVPCLLASKIASAILSSFEGDMEGKADGIQEISTVRERVHSKYHLS